MAMTSVLAILRAWLLTAATTDPIESAEPEESATEERGHACAEDPERGEPYYCLARCELADGLIDVYGYRRRNTAYHADACRQRALYWCRRHGLGVLESWCWGPDR